MKRITKLKKYEITYAPTLKIEQEVVDPYDDWNSENVRGDYIYVPIHNHERNYTEKIVVEALNKETAKAIFAVEVFHEFPFGRSFRGDKRAYVFDRIRNIVDIKEIKNDE